MGTNLSLSYGLLVAHLIPGITLSLMLILHSQLYCYIFDFNEFKSPSTFTMAFLFLIISLIFGLMLDAIRFCIIGLLKQLIPPLKKWAKYITPISSDDLQRHDNIIENHFRFHQLYGNLAIAIAFSFFLDVEYIHFLIRLFILIICFIASIFAYKTTIDQLKRIAIK